MNLQQSVVCVLALGIAVLVTASAAQQFQPAERSPQENAAPNLQQESSPAEKQKAMAGGFRNRRQMLSYAFGVELARGLKAQGVDADLEVMVNAFKDALAGNTLLMSETEATAALKAYEEDHKHDLEHAKRMIAEKNQQAGEASFAENLTKPDIVTRPSGLQYKVLKQGDGQRPTIDDTVTCQYRGTLLDGTEFDSSYKRNEPATLPLKKLIKGWSEALQLMPVGSKWQLFIPPQIGYGDRVVGGIGPNATLVFEVELLSIQTKAEATGNGGR